MTNDSDATSGGESAAGVPAPTATMSGFSSPQGMVALGGIVLIGTYIVFGLLLNDYWVGWIAMILAIAAVALPRMDGTFVEKLAPTPVLSKIVGYLLAVVGVLVVIEDLRFADGTLNEFPDVIGAIASYVGYVIAFLGARSIKP
ncbi:MAG: hypothetical protein WBM90_06635 [Acidimicrobiia bacterium]